MPGDAAPPHMGALPPLQRDTDYLCLIEQTEDRVVSVKAGDLLRDTTTTASTNARQIPGGFGIGRRSKLATTLPSAFSSRVLSRNHVNLYVDIHGAVWATDLESLHGTSVERNNRTIKLTAYEPYRLLENDVLIFGKAVPSGDIVHAPLRTSVHYVYKSPTAASDVGEFLRPTFAQSISEINLSGPRLRGYGIPIMYESEYEEDLPRGGADADEEGDAMDRDSVVYLGGFSNDTTPASDREASPENDVTEIAAADFVAEGGDAHDLHPEDPRPALPSESVTNLRQAILSSIAPFILSEEEDEEESDDQAASDDEMEVGYDDASSVGSGNSCSDEDRSEDGDDSNEERSEAGDSDDELIINGVGDADIWDDWDEDPLPPWRTGAFAFSASSIPCDGNTATEIPPAVTTVAAPTATVIPSSVPEEEAEGFFEESINADAGAEEDADLAEADKENVAEANDPITALFVDTEEMDHPADLDDHSDYSREASDAESSRPPSPPVFADELLFCEATSRPYSPASPPSSAGSHQGDDSSEVEHDAEHVGEVDSVMVPDEIEEPRVQETDESESVVVLETAETQTREVVFSLPPSPPASSGTPEAEPEACKTEEVRMASMAPLTPPSPAPKALKCTMADASSSTNMVATTDAATNTTAPIEGATTPRKRKHSALEHEEEMEDAVVSAKNTAPVASPNRPIQHRRRIASYVKAVAFGMGLGASLTFGALYQLGAE